MTDTKPRKTLTLAKKPAATAGEGESPEFRRKRSGARARQVAHVQREQEKGAAGVAPDAPARPSVKRPAGARPQSKDRPRGEVPFEKRPRNERHINDRPRGEQRFERRPRPEQRASEGPRFERHDTRADVERSPQGPLAEQTRPTIAIRPSARRKPQQRRGETFQVFAPCPHGLEEALHAELDALGYQGLRKGRAGCHFEADWSGVLRANLYSRLATRVLVRVAHAPVANEDDILALARETEWERWFGPEQTLRVDTSAVRSPMHSLQFCNLRAKDGICDRLREVEGARPDIDTVRPDARVHLFLDETSATLYLDTSGESLFKRGWRMEKGEAPLRENLAAGLLALSGWDPSAPLMDTFCGSGTILIEAAWIALGVPPGIWRPFGFERLRDHDARHWRDIKDDARSRIAATLDAPLIGYDLDTWAIQAAEGNRERAMLSPDTIQFVVGDARSVKPDCEPGWLVTNPPYGERMEEDKEFWPQWAENLKRNFAGWNVNVITSDLELPTRMRLKPKRRYPVHNGALDCRLFTFEMVEKSYRR